MERIIGFDGIFVNDDYHCFGREDAPNGRFSESGDVWDVSEDDRIMNLTEDDKIILYVNGETITALGVSNLILEVTMRNAFYDMDDI